MRRAGVCHTLPESGPGKGDKGVRSLGRGLVWLLSLGVAGYAVVAYTLLPLGANVHPQMRAVFEEHRAAILAHIFGSAVTLLLGPAQFSGSLRAGRPRLHRWLGRVYLGVGVLVGGAAGLYMAPLAFGGIVSQTGFATLAGLWLISGARAYAHARARRFDQHRAWMVRNFALAFAAVTLRLWLGAFAAAGLSFESYYPWLAWLSWAPNALAAEWLLRRRIA